MTKIPICQSRNQVFDQVVTKSAPPSLILSCATTDDDPEGFVAHCAQSCSSFVTKLRSDPAGGDAAAAAPTTRIYSGFVRSSWAFDVFLGRRRRRRRLLVHKLLI